MNNQPPPYAQECRVPSRGYFIGSIGSRFMDQQMNDLYLRHYWTTVGQLERIAFVCIHWGVSVAVVQVANALTAGHPGQFVLNPGGHASITLQNLGQDPEVQGPLPNVVPAPAGLISNGVFIQGHPLAWHDKFVLQATNNQAIHYHAHEKRDDHTITPPIDHQNMACSLINPCSCHKSLINEFQ